MLKMEKQKMKVRDLSGQNFYPAPNFRDNLEEILVYPEGEFKREGVPNGSVWVYRDIGQSYDPRILYDDVGCGIAAFYISPKIDLNAAADEIAKALKGRRILGSGNHFIDLCAPLNTYYDDVKSDGSNILVLHTDAKGLGNELSQTFQQAQDKLMLAEHRRHTLADDLSKLIGSHYVKQIGDWPHNSVEKQEGKIIYRKGSIKVVSNGNLYILPAHLGASILYYAVSEKEMPPLASMPHATGRIQRTGEGKVSEQKVKELRKMIYVPKQIKNGSLRAEHPDCFNNVDNIYKDLARHIHVIGDSKIRAYVGKI